MKRNIFIGGSGRCGTGPLLNALGTHPEIYAIPEETRFLIDPGGLLDLCDALSVRFDHYQASQAMSDFVKMFLRMKPKIDKLFGEEAATNFLRTFTNECTLGRGFRDKLVGWKREICRFKPLVNETAGLRIRELFASRCEQGQVWCEKTPYNILQAPRLRPLFADRALFVHIVRHPCGVVESLLRQDWAPDTVQACADLLSQYYARAAHIQWCVNLTIRLEDLCDGNFSGLNLVAGFANLGKGHVWDPTFWNKEHAMKWQERLPSKDQAAIQERFRDVMTRHGYA